MNDEMIRDEVVRLYNEGNPLEVVMDKLSKTIPESDYKRVKEGLENLRRKN